MRSPYTDWCTLLQSEYWKTWQNQHLVLTSYPLPKMVGKVTSYPSLALELMSSVVAEFWLLTSLLSRKERCARFWGYRLGNYYWLMESISLALLYILKESSIANDSLANEINTKKTRKDQSPIPVKAEKRWPGGMEYGRREVIFRKVFLFERLNWLWRLTVNRRRWHRFDSDKTITRLY